MLPVVVSLFGGLPLRRVVAEDMLTCVDIQLLFTATWFSILFNGCVAGEIWLWADPPTSSFVVSMKDEWILVLLKFVLFIKIIPSRQAYQIKCLITYA